MPEEFCCRRKWNTGQCLNGEQACRRERLFEISSADTYLNADDSGLLREEPGVTESRVAGAKGSRKGEGQSHRLAIAGLAFGY